MRLFLDCPVLSCEADTYDEDPDLDGSFDVLTDDGERLTIHGWLYDTIEIIDPEYRAPGWYEIPAGLEAA